MAQHLRRLAFKAVTVHQECNLLLKLRSPRDYVRSSVRSRLWYVLDRQLLNG